MDKTMNAISKMLPAIEGMGASDNPLENQLIAMVLQQYFRKELGDYDATDEDKQRSVYQSKVLEAVLKKVLDPDAISTDPVGYGKEIQDVYRSVTGQDIKDFGKRGGGVKPKPEPQIEKPGDYRKGWGYMTMEEDGVYKNGTRAFSNPDGVTGIFEPTGEKGKYRFIQHIPGERKREMGIVDESHIRKHLGQHWDPAYKVEKAVAPAMRPVNEQVEKPITPDTAKGINPFKGDSAGKMSGAGGDFEESPQSKQQALATQGKPYVTMTLPGRPQSPGSQPRDAAKSAMAPIYRAGEGQQDVIKWLSDFMKRTPYGM